MANVVFENNPAPGRYRVVVDYFDRADGPTTPYRVTIRQEGQPDRVITGTARQGVRDQVVGEFTVPPLTSHSSANPVAAPSVHL